MENLNHTGLDHNVQHMHTDTNYVTNRVRVLSGSFCGAKFRELSAKVLESESPWVKLEPEALAQARDSDHD